MARASFPPTILIRFGVVLFKTIKFAGFCLVLLAQWEKVEGTSEHVEIARGVQEIGYCIFRTVKSPINIA